MPTFGSLFTGVGGFDLGLERAGWTCAFQCEIDPFCQRVLGRHWPDVPRTSDVRAVAHPDFDRGAGYLERAGTDQRPDGGAAERDTGARIDLLVGGFPCQDLSVAGKRAGLDGARSGLFWEFLRVARELSPEWLLLENVPGLLSSNHGRDFGTLLAGLEECGYGWAYRILDSQYFGVAQRRRRVFIVGHRGGPVPPAVLFEPEGRARHPAPGREAGAGVAASLTSGTHGAGVSAPGRRKEDDVNLVSPTLDADFAKHFGQNDQGVNLLLQLGRPVVGTSYKGHDDDTDTLLVTGALRHLGSGGVDDNEAQAGHRIAHTSDVAPVLRGFGHGWQGQHNDDASKMGMVRRLTPTETERLQGFPDGWTCLCEATPYSTMTCRCPDSARYRAMGNAVTVPVIEWIGRQLLAVLPL